MKLGIFVLRWPYLYNLLYKYQIEIQRMNEEQSISSREHRDEWSNRTQRAPMSRVTLTIEIILVLLRLILIDYYDHLLCLCWFRYTASISRLHCFELGLSADSSSFSCL